MSAWAAPLGYALFLWWFSTGVILLADRLPRISARGALSLATLIGLAAILAVWLIKDQTTIGAAFIGFTAGVILWGWHEVSFLSGIVTGPRRSDCPADARGWKRFVYAAQTLIHHELAIAATVIGLVALLWGVGNQVALWTFLVLWGMRLSTKFNIFLGVPNVTEEFLPNHLSHLKSYFRTRPLNLLFPLSITAGTALTFWLAHFALGAGADAYTTAAFMLLATMAGLGVLEHWFLVLPLRDAELWRWYLQSTNKQSAAPSAERPTSTSQPTSYSTSTLTTSAGPTQDNTAFRAHTTLRGHQS